MGLFKNNIVIEKKPSSYSINTTKNIITESTKGITELGKTVRTKDVGEEHPFDYKTTEKLYLEMGFVSGVVDKIVDFLWGPGFFIKSDNTRAKAIIEQWLDDVNFKLHGRKWVRQALIKGFSPLELGGKPEQPPDSIKVLYSDNVYIKRDKYGVVTGVNQVVGREDPVRFSPEQIAILNFNQTGDSPYGYGLVYPALKTINNLLAAERDMHKIIMRKANNPLIAKLGNKETGEIPTQEAIDSFGDKMTYMNNVTEWAVSANVDFTTVDFGKTGEKFQFVLDYDQDMLFFTFQIPEVLMGRGNIPEGLAGVQQEAFDRFIKSKQVEIEAVIEGVIFQRILKANGLQAKVDFEWGQPSLSEKNNRISQLTMLLNNGMLNPGLRLELELQLAELLDIPKNKITPPEKEREEEEEEEEQPRVPGSNEERFLHENAGLEEGMDLSVQEWLGFNYKDYLKKIIQFIDKDDFSNLAGTTELEIARGKLNKEQITNLKNVLKENFKNGSTIRKISDDINEQVRPGNLEVYDDEDNLRMTIPAATRAINIGRTETTRTANEGSRAHYKSKSVQEYRWVAAVSDRTCETCLGLNGEIFSINSSNIPPAHNLCRCSIVPVVELTEETA